MRRAARPAEKEKFEVWWTEMNQKGWNLTALSRGQWNENVMKVWILNQRIVSGHLLFCIQFCLLHLFCISFDLLWEIYVQHFENRPSGASLYDFCYIPWHIEYARSLASVAEGCYVGKSVVLDIGFEWAKIRNLVSISIVFEIFIAISKMEVLLCSEGRTSTTKYFLTRNFWKDRPRRQVDVIFGWYRKGVEHCSSC